MQLGELGDPQAQAPQRNRAALDEEQCHMHQPSFTVDRSDLTALREGERNIGLRLLNQMERVCPDAWKKIVIEQMEASIKARREHDNELRDAEQDEDEEPNDE